MINFLEIKNYESHKATRLDFSPGVNVITGLSDKGKSTILRALRWVAENRPGGFGFKPWSARKGARTEVLIGLDSGQQLQRLRGGTENLYFLDDEKLEGFGQEVPGKIKEVLNLSEGALQRQLDPVYLLADSPGEVARVFNKVTNLKEIDVLLSNLTSLYNSTGREAKLVESDLVGLNEQLVEFDDLPQIEKLIKGIEIADGWLSEKEEKISVVELIIESISRADSELVELEDFLCIEKEFSVLVTQLERYRLSSDKIDNLADLIADIESINEELASIIDVSAVDERLTNDLLIKIETIGALETKISRLVSEIDNFHKFENELVELEDFLCIEKEFDVLVTQLAQFDLLSNKIENLTGLISGVEVVDKESIAMDSNIMGREVEYKEKIEGARDLVCPVVQEFGECIYGYQKMKRVRKS